MPKGIQRKKGRRGLSRKQAQSGDTYQMTTDIEIADVDGDGVSDLTFTHTVDKNNEAWVKAEVVWYGLPPEVNQAFIGELAAVGFIDEEVVETNKLNRVVKHWKNLTKALAGINRLGEQLVQQVGEEVED